MTDDGLEFYAVCSTESGRFTRETDNRAELLDWIDVRRKVGGIIVEVGSRAIAPPAIDNMIAALRFGAEKLR